MPIAVAVNEDLLRQLPLPLAQLYRRAHNAKTPQERHHAAYYLWEATLKLLGAVAIVEYAELGDHDPELTERLQNLARPSLGHWWEFVRRLVPVLAGKGVAGFAAVRELVLGRGRDDLPHTAGLDAVLVQVLEGRETGARATVRLTELFDRLVRYRNQEFGHGATGQRPAAFYERVGGALLAALPELLGRLEVLAGRRLLYVADVRRQTTGRWLVERYELRGETQRRLESLDLPDGDAVRRLLPDRLYLEALVPGKEDKGDGQRVVSLHPLLVYEADSSEALYLNARRGRQRIEYLSYSSGRTAERAEFAEEQRDLLARVLRVPVDAPKMGEWAARSQAEEQQEAGPTEEPAAPRRLGEFELLSELGRGGMGVVYRAWQPSLGRQVAVKSLYRTGDPKAEARFAREIRALGHVEHPYLVKIFTSGSEGEQWFYAMELVEGATLAAVCEKLQGKQSRPETVDFQTWQAAVSTVYSESRQAEKPVSDRGPRSDPAPPAAPAEGDAPRSPFRFGDSYVRQAVELVRQVAEAAHALHERGILHRDIKPGNVMVTQDGSQAVLMDLGLAQIADEVGGRLTKTRQFVGTLRYASPEQVLAVGGLDRRSDVYNLGATLWELLTLQPMFSATEQTPTPELMRRIQVEEPEHPRKYHPRLSRDLDAIVLKCLEKDAGRRYATARELVRDLERYQAGEPVRARPVGRVQRGWRWCRRNPVVSGMLALLAVVIAGSLVGLTMLYLNAERQRAIAEHKEAGARAVSKFYEEHVLSAARPKGWAGGAGRDVTLKEALDQAGPKIDEAFAGQPELEAAVRDTLGMTYYYLGQYEGGTPHLEKAYQIRLSLLGPDHPDTLTSLHHLGMQRWKQGRYDEAVTLGRQAFEKRRRVLGPEDPETLWSELFLGLFLSEESQYDEAEAVLRDAIEICKRTVGPDDVRTLHGQNDLALVLSNKGKFQESMEMDRDTLERRSRSLGPEHPDTLRSVANLACSYWNLDRLEEAETLCRKGLEARRRVLGEGHTETFWSWGNLAGILRDRGKLAEAEQTYRQTYKECKRYRGAADAQTLACMTSLAYFLRDQGKLEEAEHLFRDCTEICRHKYGPEHLWTLWREGQLARILGTRGKVEEAEKLYRHTWEAQRRVRGPEHPDTLTTMNNLALLLSDQGKNEESEKLFRDLLAIRRRVQGADHPDALFVQENLGYVLREEGKYAEAEALFRAAVEARRRLNGAEHNSTLASQNYLANLLTRSAKFAEAEKLHRQNLEIRRRVLGPENAETLWSLSNLGYVYEQQGRLDEAERVYRETLEIRRRVLGAEQPDTLGSQNTLANLLGSRGKLAEAEKLHRQTLEIRQRLLGAEHTDTLWSQTNLALVLAQRGKAAEAEKLYRQALETRRKALGPDHPDTLSNQSSLASLLDDIGRAEEAEKLYRQTLAAQRRRLGLQNPQTLATQHDLAVLLGDRSKRDEAEKLLRQTLEVRRRLFGAEHPATLSTQEALANLLADQGRDEDAEKQYRDVLAAQRKVLGPDHLDVASTQLDLGLLLTKRGRATEAEPLLREGLAIREKQLTADHWQVAVARSVLGASLVGQKKFAEAEPLLLAGGAGVTRANGAPLKQEARAIDRLIELYEKWEKPPEADAWRKKRPAATP